MAADQGDEGEVALKTLVVNSHAFQRRLIAETLRGFGRVDITFAEGVDQGLAAIGFVHPDLLIADWSVEGADGLALVKRVRMGDAGDAVRRVPVVMIGDRARSSDLA